MTTTEKIEAIKAISVALPAFGTFDAKHDAIMKLSEIIASLDPHCKCKQKQAVDIWGCKLSQPITCNSTADTLSLPNTTPAS